MRYPLVIIGAGLAGLAAGIRMARFGNKVLILEQHNRPGGLNSYYTRQGHLFETGLHAMTNFALPGDRHAPLNRLFRQLTLSRKNFKTHEQKVSEIRFPNDYCLRFSNDFTLLQKEIARLFPDSIDKFAGFIRTLDEYDSFQPNPWYSTREILHDHLDNPTLEEMLLWPAMVYGNSSEDDMDFSQFAIIFRSIFQEGLFRPTGTMKDFLHYILDHYRSLGGEIRFNEKVTGIEVDKRSVTAVKLASGKTIECQVLFSTAGLPVTQDFLTEAGCENPTPCRPGNISIFESIALLPKEKAAKLAQERTIIFFNNRTPCSFRMPKNAVDVESGVICFNDGFQGIEESPLSQLHITHLANYDHWKQATPDNYRMMKEDFQQQSWDVVANILGDFSDEIVFADSFTPTTIERYTNKRRGAVYGSPDKQKDGCTVLDNLFLAGTDQGFLGIVGAMISGASMVNIHILLENKNAQ